MPNRQLTATELETANVLLAEIRDKLDALSHGDSELLFAYRRKIAKQLVYDERSSPMARRALKRRMLVAQDGKCALCNETLPPTYNVLDRFDAIKGYVDENVRLICEGCDRKVQLGRRYT